MYFKFVSFGGIWVNNDWCFFYKLIIVRSVYSKVFEVVVNGKFIVICVDILFDVVLIGSGNRVNLFLLVVND